MVGEYLDAGINLQGFLLSEGRFTKIDVPAAFGSGTQALGINPQGDIVGIYVEGHGTSSTIHGFLLDRDSRRDEDAESEDRDAGPS
jgi:hypothetical protein